MAQAASRRPLSNEARVQSYASPVGFVLDKLTQKWVLLLTFRFYPVGIIAPMLRIYCSFISHRR
jgi:hypothetical protein